MKKNGFTLIELLAVILILGVIALIAIPTTAKLIKSSKMEAFEVSIKNIMNSVEQNCQLEQLKKNEHTSVYSFMDDNINPKINIDKSSLKAGSISVNSECKVTNVNVSNGFYTAVLNGETIEIEDQVVFENIKYANGTTIYFNPVTGNECIDYLNANSNTGEKGNVCMKWYIFNDKVGETNVSMILDHNTTGMVPYTSETEGEDVFSRLASDTSEWSDELNPRLISAIEVAEITGKTDFDYTKMASYFQFDTNANAQSPTCNKDDTTGCHYGWLYDRTRNSCNRYGCANNSIGTDVFGYWTSTSTSVYAWRVQFVSRLNLSSATTTDQNGVRPVITVPKSKIF